MKERSKNRLNAAQVYLLTKNIAEIENPFPNVEQLLATQTIALGTTVTASNLKSCLRACGRSLDEIVSEADKSPGPVALLARKLERLECVVGELRREMDEMKAVLS